MIVKSVIAVVLNHMLLFFKKVSDVELLFQLHTQVSTGVRSDDFFFFKY